MSFPPQSAEADTVQLWTVKVVFMKKLNVIFLRFPDLPSADLTLISESSSNTNWLRCPDECCALWMLNTRISIVAGSSDGSPQQSSLCCITPGTRDGDTSSLAASQHFTQCIMQENRDIFHGSLPRHFQQFGKLTGEPSQIISSSIWSFSCPSTQIFVCEEGELVRTARIQMFCR